jgi:cytochrome c-type biogenesis protein CcmH
MTFESVAPALLVFGVGAFAGLALALRSRGGADASARTARDDHERTHKEVVDALRALELEKHKLPDADYAAQRAALLARGAAALAALDQLGPTPVDAVDPLAVVRTHLETQRAALGDRSVDLALARLRGDAVSPAWLGAAYTLVAVAVVGGLVYTLSGSVRDRAAGGSLTGGPMMASGGEPRGPMQAPDEGPPPAVQALLERVAANADDLDAHLALTEWAIGNENLQAAMEHNSEALRISPENPDGKTHRAFLRLAIGRGEDALRLLEEVRQANPEHLPSLGYLMVISLAQGDTARAEAALAELIARDPGNREAYEGRFRMLAEREAAGPADPHPASAPAPSGGGDVVVAGEILGLPASAPAGSILFVSVRDPAGGPPLAALRLAPGASPMRFEVTQANAIAMGGAPRPFPAVVDVSVRLDGDGDPMSRADGDLEARLPGISLGERGLRVQL